MKWLSLKMNENERKQQLSLAYVHTVASYAGFACEQIRVDHDSVDLSIKSCGYLNEDNMLRSPMIDIQMKATSQIIPKSDNFTFTLSIKNYNDLRLRTLVPRILIVFILPLDRGEWIELTEEQMVFRKCAYWKSLLGMPDTDNKHEISIIIPRENLLTPSSLENILIKVASGKPIENHV